MPAPRIGDRWLWLAFGIFFFVAAKSIRFAVKDVVQLTELGPSQYEPSTKKEEELADKITLKDLQVLADSENAAISSAAIQLIMHRVKRDPHIYRAIMKDSEQHDDEDLRVRAKQTISYLRTWRYDINARMDDIDSMSGSASPIDIASTTSDGLEDLARRLADVAEINGDGWVDSAASMPRVVVPSLENPVAGWTNVPRERPEMSEAERRRLRREAVVFREGEGGVEESDIIRPSMDR